MKKKFLLLHRPASLRRVDDNSTLYIEFSQYNPALDKVVRIRRTYGLNIIKDKKLQVRRAKELVSFINSQLPLGYPFVEVEKIENHLVHTPIMEALEGVYKIKMMSDRKNTRRTMQSTWNIFSAWLRREGYDSLTISQFEPRHAKQYMDYVLVERKVGNNTYNNYLTCIKVYFNELVRGDYILKNPFRKILRKKKMPANRRRFTPKERNVIAQYFYNNDIWMFYAIMLQYYCFIRPVELIRLKRSMFDLERQLIHLPPTVLKTKETRYATIPDSIIEFFKHDRFRNIPNYHFVFGPGICPGRVQYKNEDKMYKKHKKVLNLLYKQGKLENIDQLIWYSWKYTGNKDAEAEIKNIRSLQKQNGHSTVKQTLTYLAADPDEINEGFKKRTFQLLEDSPSGS